jgi:hypothetical protein
VCRSAHSVILPERRRRGALDHQQMTEAVWVTPHLRSTWNIPTVGIVGFSLYERLKIPTLLDYCRWRDGRKFLQNVMRALSASNAAIQRNGTECCHLTKGSAKSHPRRRRAGVAFAVRSGRCPVRAQGSKVRGCRPSRRCMKSWRAGAVICALRRDSEHCPFQPCRAQLLALCGPICGRRYRLQDPVGHSRTGYASSGEERNRGLIAARRRFLTF